MRARGVNSASLHPSVGFPVLLALGLGLPAGAQDFVASARDFVHPHDVHDVQADAGEDPGAAPAEGDLVEGFRPVHGAHPAVVDRHDGDPHQEKHEGHQYPVGHVGLGRFGVT